VKNKKEIVVKEAKGINLYYCLTLLVIVPLLLNWKALNYDYTKFDDSSIISNNIGFLVISEMY